MAELRRRYKGEVEALSDYLDRDLVSLWGYDGRRLSARPRRRLTQQRAAGLLHRWPRQGGTTALYEMLRASSAASTCRDDKEPWFFASDMRPRFAAAARRAAAGDARAVPARCSLTPARTSAPARPPRPICGRGPRPRRSPRYSREARIVAILREPASFLRSLHLQLVQTHVETSQGSRAERSHSKPSVARDARSPAAPTDRSCCSTREHVRYVEQLRRYHAVFARRAGAGADLRGVPCRQRRHRAQRAALPRRRGVTRRSTCCRPTRPCTCARSS